MAIQPYKNKVANEILAQRLLNFPGLDQAQAGEITKTDGQRSAIPPLPPAQTSAKKDEGGTSEILGNTFRDLLPALFGVGAGLIGKKAGLSANDALGLGITSLNTATSVQDTYRNNKQRYYNRVASKLVDDYVAKAGGQVDPNMIYKTLSDEHPDVFKNINPGEFIQTKMAERNKVIDLSTKEFTGQAQQFDAYKSSKRTAYKSDGMLISPDPKVGPDMYYNYVGFSAMKRRLDEFLKTQGEGHEVFYRGGKFSFSDPSDFKKFTDYIGTLKEESDADNTKYAYDIDQVLQDFNQPSVSDVSQKNADAALLNAKTRADKLEFYKFKKNNPSVPPSLWLSAMREARILKEKDTSKGTESLTVTELAKKLLSGNEFGYASYTSADIKKMQLMNKELANQTKKAALAVKDLGISEESFLNEDGMVVMPAEYDLAMSEGDLERATKISTTKAAIEAAHGIHDRLLLNIKSNEPIGGGGATTTKKDLPLK